VEVGHQHPQQAQQAEGQQRVINPQQAARVSSHTNTCSYEQAFACKNYARHRRVTILPWLLPLFVALAACLPDPHRQQTSDLLDQLTSARQLLLQQAPTDQACPIVGDVETRLNGEPGLMSVQPAWSQLADAAHALQAVCGQSTLLAQPSIDSPASQAARLRWQQGIQRELDVACDHLRAAAAALNRAATC